MCIISLYSNKTKFFPHILYPICTEASNLFFNQTRESSLVPAGFLTAQFLQKTEFLKPLFDGGNWVMFHSIAFLEERECVEKLVMM